jgi:hypothetical protein
MTQNAKSPWREAEMQLHVPDKLLMTKWRAKHNVVVEVAEAAVVAMLAVAVMVVVPKTNHSGPDSGKPNRMHPLLLV